MAILGTLFQCFASLNVKKSFLLLRWNFLCLQVMPKVETWAVCGELTASLTTFSI